MYAGVRGRGRARGCVRRARPHMACAPAAGRARTCSCLLRHLHIRAGICRQTGRHGLRHLQAGESVCTCLHECLQGVLVHVRKWACPCRQPQPCLLGGQAHASVLQRPACGLQSHIGRCGRVLHEPTDAPPRQRRPLGPQPGVEGRLDCLPDMGQFEQPRTRVLRQADRPAGRGHASTVADIGRHEQRLGLRQTVGRHRRNETTADTVSDTARPGNKTRARHFFCHRVSTNVYRPQTDICNIEIGSILSD